MLLEVMMKIQIINKKNMESRKINYRVNNEECLMIVCVMNFNIINIYLYILFEDIIMIYKMSSTT